MQDYFVASTRKLGVDPDLAPGAKVLYTEDLQHESVVGGVRVVDPFVD